MPINNKMHNVIEGIKHIYIEEGLKGERVEQNIIQRAPKTAQIEYIQDASRILRQHRQEGNKESRQKLLVHSYKGRFFSSCPGSDGMVCCQYFVLHLGQGCLYNCHYCYLQGFLNNPLITLHGNLNELFTELDKIIQKKNFPFRIGTGEYTDSLLLEPLTGQAAALVEYFSRLPHAVLELKTKSSHVDSLLNLEHRGRTVVSWSLNPPALINKIEEGTASLEERLEAAAKVQEAGYRVGFHLDPVIYFEDWEKQYHNLIDSIFSVIKPDNTAWISIGSFRYTPALKKIIQANFPEDTLIRQGEMSPGSDGKYRYFKTQRQEMFVSIKKKIESVNPRLFLYLCMENKRMWQNVFGFIPDTKRHLDSLFAKRQRYLSGLKKSAVCILFLLWTLPQSAQEAFKKPQNLSIVNSNQEDYSPQISPDGCRLIFQSNRPGEKEGHNLWTSKNKNCKDPLGKAQWTKSAPLSSSISASVNTDNFEGYPSLIYRNSLPVELYFTFAKTQNLSQGEEKKLYIYYTHLTNPNKIWSEPRPIIGLNSKFDDRMASLSQGEADYLIFSSNRPGGLGGYDLWISQRGAKTWAEPVNAGANINTNFNESAPRLSPDGMTLFFSSDRPGGLGYYDLYMSRRSEDKDKDEDEDEELWGKANHLKSPFNSHYDDEGLSPSRDGLWAYFSSDREGGKGNFDIYRLRLPLDLFHPHDVLFTGQIRDGSSKEILGLNASIHILSGETGKNSGETQIIRSRVFAKQAGAKKINNFQVYIKSGRHYRVRISSPGFIPQELHLDYQRNIPAGMTDRHIISLQKIRKKASPPPLESDCKKEEAVCLDLLHIYFDSNSAQIKTLEAEKIQRTVRILKRNPALKVRIEGHTDTISTESYNQKLSEKRAEAVSAALGKAGIDKKRISTRGHSFLRPAVKEKSLQDRSLNRRVEFVRLK